MTQFDIHAAKLLESFTPDCIYVTVQAMVNIQHEGSMIEQQVKQGFIKSLSVCTLGHSVCQIAALIDSGSILNVQQVSAYKRTGGIVEKLVNCYHRKFSVISEPQQPEKKHVIFSLPTIETMTETITRGRPTTRHSSRTSKPPSWFKDFKKY